MSPLSDDLEPTKPASKTKASEQHPVHVQKNKEKNRDSSIKVEKKPACLDHPNPTDAAFLPIA